MMKTNSKTKILIIILAISPLIIYMWLYKSLPSKIPTSYDFSGNITDYSSKLTFLFIPILILIVPILYYIIPKIDPKRQNYSKFSKFYNSFLVVLLVFFNLLFYVTLINSLNSDTISMNIAVPFFVGVLFVFMGNYMPTARQNFYFGIKTAWTLSSETVWNKTHRIGGYCFVFSGLLLMIIPFFNESFLPIFIFVMLTSTGLPVLMSYIYYTKEQKK